jgi:hypothetical protein
MSEFRFTFVRGAPEREERRESFHADSMEEAAAEAGRFCKRHDCMICSVEWFDEEAKRWRQSDVCYA